MSLGWLTESSLIPRKPKKLKIDQDFNLELEKLTRGSRNRAAHAPTNKSMVELLTRKTAATKALAVAPDRVASQPECFLSEELKVDSSYTKPHKPASNPHMVSYRLPAWEDLREAVALVKRHRKESQERATTQAKNMKRAKLLLESEL